MRKLVVAAVSASLLVSGAVTAATARPEPAAAAPAYPDLSVVTYNVRSCCTSGGDLLTGSEAWPKREAAVVKKLVAAAPDVIVLQEVTPYHHTSGTKKRADGTPVNAPDRRPTLQILGDLRDALPAKQYDRASSENGARVVLYSKQRLTKSPMTSSGGTIPDSFKAGARGSDPGVYTVNVQFIDKRAGNEKFSIAGLHLTKGRGEDDEAKRLRQITDIYSLVRPRARAYGSEGRTLFVGDFNTHPGAAGGYRVGPYLSAKTNVGDTMSVATTLVGKGYSTYKGGFGAPRTGSVHYDRAFIDRGDARSWTAVKWENLYSGHNGASDHTPVRITLRYT